MNYLLHVGVMLTIIKVFINLFLLVRIGNILAIFKVNQFKVLLSMSSAILLYKMKSLFFSQLTKIFRKHKPVSFKFCINFGAIKHNSSILFLAQALHTSVKSRFSSARAKIRQIPHVNFELTSRFLFKVCIILHCHDTKLPCNF